MTNNLTRTTLRVSLALLMVPVLLNSACAIMSYSPTESLRKPLAETHDKPEFLSFSYSPGSHDLDSRHRTLPWESQWVKDLFEQHSRFMKVVVTASPPALGVHVNVYQTDGFPISPWCIASNWTLNVIPCYVDGIVYRVYFDVFVDNVLKQSYRYDISRKGVAWIGLLPFFRVDLFTTQYKEALSTNVYQFVTDARRDGFL
jgi:hypothetical protein